MTGPKHELSARQVDLTQQLLYEANELAHAQTIATRQDSLRSDRLWTRDVADFNKLIGAAAAHHDRSRNGNLVKLPDTRTGYNPNFMNDDWHFAMNDKSGLSLLTVEGYTRSDAVFHGEGLLFYDNPRNRHELTARLIRVSSTPDILDTDVPPTQEILRPVPDIMKLQAMLDLLQAVRDDVIMELPATKAHLSLVRPISGHTDEQ